MKIKALIEKADGMYEFTADLSADQHQFLVEYAIRDLIMKGLMPFDAGIEEEKGMIVHEGVGDLQQ